MLFLLGLARSAFVLSFFLFAFSSFLFFFLFFFWREGGFFFIFIFFWLPLEEESGLVSCFLCVVPVICNDSTTTHLINSPPLLD